MKNPREDPGSERWLVLFWLGRVEIITVHGQDVQTFIDDQQGQIIIIIITVVVEIATGQQLRSKCQLTFHSRSFRVRDSRDCGRGRDLKTEVPGQGCTSGEPVRVLPQAEQLKLEQQHGQVDWGQQGVIWPGSPEAWS